MGITHRTFVRWHPFRFPILLASSWLAVVGVPLPVSALCVGSLSRSRGPPCTKAMHNFPLAARDHLLLFRNEYSTAATRCSCSGNDARHAKFTEFAFHPCKGLRMRALVALHSAHVLPVALFFDSRCRCTPYVWYKIYFLRIPGGALACSVALQSSRQQPLYHAD